MTVDLEPDDIDERWRRGLASATTAAGTGARARIDARVARRHRARLARKALGGTLAAVLVAVAILGLPHRRNVKVATRAPITNVIVDDGRDNTLTIRQPGQSTNGGAITIDVPAGRVSFTVRYYGTHELVLDGVPAFRAPRGSGGRLPTSVVATVTLRPGRYRLHCIIPGHTTAGEVAWIVVR